MNEGKPGHDRHRRPLPWLLFLLGAFVMLELGAGIGWFAIHASAGKGYANGSGVGYALDRAGRGATATGVGSSGTGSGQVRTVSAGATTRTTTAGDAVVPTTTTTNLRTLTVSTAVQGELAPGVARPLVIRIANNGAAAVRVTFVQVTAGQPSARACRAGWYAVTGRVPAATVIASQSSARLTWQMVLRDLPRLNQDACKGARVPFRVRVEAVEAPA